MAAGVLTGDPVAGLKALSDEDGRQQELEGLSDRELLRKASREMLIAIRLVSGVLPSQLPHLDGVGNAIANWNVRHARTDGSDWACSLKTDAAWHRYRHAAIALHYVEVVDADCLLLDPGLSRAWGGLLDALESTRTSGPPVRVSRIANAMTSSPQPRRHQRWAPAAYR